MSCKIETTGASALKNAMIAAAGFGAAMLVVTILDGRQQQDRGNSGATEVGAFHERLKQDVSPEQMARLEALVEQSFGEKATITATGAAPYGFRWLVVSKDGTRQVAWASPGELSLSVGDFFVGGANLSESVRLAVSTAAPAAEAAKVERTSQTAAPLLPMPAQQPAMLPAQQDEAEFQTIATRHITPSGIDMGIATAFAKVADSFASVSLYGDGSGGELLVFADPDCGYCHNLLGMLNERASGFQKEGFRVRWYPVGILRPRNNESLNRAAAMLQAGAPGLLAGGRVQSIDGVTQDALKQVALNTKALSEILPQNMRTPTILYRSRDGLVNVLNGHPGSDEALDRIIGIARSA